MAERKEVTEVRSEQYEPERGRHIFTYKLTQAIWLLLGILEGFLALRFLLKLMAANPGSPIAALIYSFTSIFLVPFSGLTATPAAGGIVLEISTLFAMLIYGLIGWVIVRLAWLIFSRPRGPVVEVTKTKSREEQDTHLHAP
jgi:YggT family protein